jgi:hypothetical protein
MSQMGTRGRQVLTVGEPCNDYRNGVWTKR